MKSHGWEFSWTVFLFVIWIEQLGIAHINPNKNNKYDSLLLELAQEHPQLVFLDLSPEHPEYKAALRTFAIHDEENIIAIDRKS